MNGFKKNKNGTTKRSVNPKANNDQLGENASEEFKAENYQNAQNPTKKKQPTSP